MNIKPGNIFHRKYSDENDLYCVIFTQPNPYPRNLVVDRYDIVCLFPYYQSRGENYYTEEEHNVATWFESVDLNKHEIKEKFLNKIKVFLDENVGQPISYDKILDNLTYIEILAALQKYEEPVIIEGGDNKNVNA